MEFHAWLTSSLIRHYPHTQSRRCPRLAIEVALNERFSFQLAVRAGGGKSVDVDVKTTQPKGWNVRIRRVGYVPVAHLNVQNDAKKLDKIEPGRIPGFVPDPLFPESAFSLPPGETHAFWFTVDPGENAKPKRHVITVVVSVENQPDRKLEVLVNLRDVFIEPRSGFNVTNWFYADSLIDWYQTDLFDDRFWRIFKNYVANLVSHGQDTLYAPIFTPPLDGVKRPTQLLGVSKKGRNEYHFDWSAVREYVKTARSLGVTHFEWSHLFTQWGCENAIRIYAGRGETEEPLWKPETGATSRTYRSFLKQFLPRFRQFLAQEGIFRNSFFHVSDEPHGETHLANYRKAREMLRELAPWMRVMDALSEIEFGREKLTDTPVPAIQTAPDFVREEIDCWCYYCCSQKGRLLNRLVDTPLPKIAMHGFLLYRWPFEGFLHWGYNYWYRRQTRRLIDPFVTLDAGAWRQGWVYGDPFVVYPGDDGPIDSIRWEIFAEGLRDYALLKTLNVDRDDELFNPIRNFSDFPKTEEWRRSVKSKLYDRCEARKYNK